ncbi:MAG: T9SS type A sorting domain-containing protein [Bacteroidales bacterium]|jgi:hypothetical protein|nr:T9SS type A sorting domain-containing protein [Bacteroidales bacterium]
MKKIFVVLTVMFAATAVANAQSAAVVFEGVSGMGVLSDTFVIVLDASKVNASVGLVSGEAIYLHPFYKYKQNVEDMNDQTIAPCGWGNKCYAMTYSEGQYRYTIKNIAEFFSIAGDWKGERPIGFGFVFYNDGATKEIKADGGGDFWISVRQDYKIDIYVHEQEDHRIEGVYHYYIGDSVRLKIDRFLMYNNTWYKSDDRQFPINILSDDSVLTALPSDVPFLGGEYIQSFPLPSVGAQIVTAQTTATQNNRKSSQQYSIVVNEPIVTLSQSTSVVKEVEGENVDTIWASIPAATKSNVTVPLNVTGSFYELSAETIVIPAGRTRAFTLLYVLDDGQSGSRDPLTISAGTVQCADRTFTATGTLTLNILNYPVIYFTTVHDGELIPTGTERTITATTGDNCSWEMFINGSSVQTASATSSISYNWIASANGLYVIKAVATNSENNTTVKEITVEVIDVEDIPSPIISFVRPASGAVFSLGETVVIEVSAEYADSLFFYADNVLLQNGMVGSQCLYQPIATGNHTIEVIARNNARKQTSVSRTIEVTDYPSVEMSLVSAVNGTIAVNVGTFNADSLFLYLLSDGDSALYFSGVAPDMLSYSFDNLSQGTYSVKAVVKDGLGRTGMAVLNDIQVSGYTANEHLDNVTVKVYPNPVTSGSFTVEGGLGEYTLCDISGRKIKSGILSGTTTIDITSLKGGVYLLYAKGIIEKIIKN